MNARCSKPLRRSGTHAILWIVRKLLTAPLSLLYLLSPLHRRHQRRLHLHQLLLDLGVVLLLLCLLLGGQSPHLVLLGQVSPSLHLVPLVQMKQSLHLVLLGHSVPLHLPQAPSEPRLPLWLTLLLDPLRVIMLLVQQVHSVLRQANLHSATLLAAQLLDR